MTDDKGGGGGRDLPAEGAAPGRGGVAGPGGATASGAIAAVATGRASASGLAAEAVRRCEDADGGEVVAVLDPGSGEGPLAGATVGVKDLVDVAGQPRSLGLPAVGREAPAQADAEVVGRLRAAGAAVVARLALHPIAFGVTGAGVRNPAAPDRLPGGSSNGSAAAIAGGLVHAALGTDTGGSIRIPASCCGISGLKPTLGAASTRGVQSLAWSLDTIGPMAATVADLARLWAVMAGHDPADPASEPAPWELDGSSGPVVGAEPDPARLRVLGRPAGLVAAREVLEVADRFAAQAQGAGVRVVDVELPSLRRAHRGNGDVLCAEAAAVWGEALKADQDVLGDEIGPRVRYGAGLRAADVARHRRLGRTLRAELRAALSDVDALFLPTLPCRAPVVGAREIDAGDDEPTAVTPALTRFTNPWNLTGVPAGALPIGRDLDGAPVGGQVVAGPWQERTVLDGMAALERLPLVEASS